MEIKYEIRERIIKILWIFDRKVYDLVRINFNTIKVDPGSAIDWCTIDWCTSSRVIKTYKNLRLAKEGKYQKERAFF